MFIGPPTQHSRGGPAVPSIRMAAVRAPRHAQEHHLSQMKAPPAQMSSHIEQVNPFPAGSTTPSAPKLIPFAFAYDETGKLMKEITAAVGSITWTSHLVNRNPPRKLFRAAGPTAIRRWDRFTLTRARARPAAEAKCFMIDV